jgi:hypothetical protein
MMKINSKTAGLAEPPFDDRPGGNPSSDRREHAGDAGDNGPTSECLKSFALDGGSFCILFKQPSFGFSTIFAVIFAAAMFKPQPKLMWPECFKGFAPALAFVGHVLSRRTNSGSLAIFAVNSSRHRSGTLDIRPSLISSLFIAALT